MLLIKTNDRHAATQTDAALFKAYSWLDQTLFHPEPDALRRVNIEDLVGAIPTIETDVGDLHTALESASDFDLDVVLNFCSAKLNQELAKISREGVWFYAFARDGASHQAPPGFWEVMNEEPITALCLTRLHGNPPREEVIYASRSPTLSRFSVRLNANGCYWKSSAFVVRKLLELYHQLSDKRSEVPKTVHDCPSRSSIELPNNAKMVTLFGKLALRAGSRIVEKALSKEQWILAFRINDPQQRTSAKELKYLTPPADRFWADPFPLKVDGAYYIFFEEFLYARNKAHISVIEVDEDGIKSGPAEVLNLDYHLSYPFVFEWNGNYYLIPESGEKNVVQLYRATSFPFKWEPDKVLLEANSPLDATLIEVNGRWWMFVNIQEEGVRINWDELHLYYADSPLGPWLPHARNPVVSDVRSARPAGRLFWTNNVLYRPSQDSSIRYGYATTINEITVLNPDEYEERQVSKILPDWDENILGVHTLNVFDDLTVIDCLIRRRSFGNQKLRRPQTLGTTHDVLQWQTRTT